MAEDEPEKSVVESNNAPDDANLTAADSSVPPAREPPILSRIATAKGNESGRNGPLREPSRAISRAPSATELPSFSALHEIAFISIICSGQILTQSGLAQSIAPLHVIGASFGITDPTKLSWMPAAYSLTATKGCLSTGTSGLGFGH
jgi:hypothetical protein